MLTVNDLPFTRIILASSVFSAALLTLGVGRNCQRSPHSPALKTQSPTTMMSARLISHLLFTSVPLALSVDMITSFHQNRPSPSRAGPWSSWAWLRGVTWPRRHRQRQNRHSLPQTSRLRQRHQPTGRPTPGRTALQCLQMMNALDYRRHEQLRPKCHLLYRHCQNPLLPLLLLRLLPLRWRQRGR